MEVSHLGLAASLAHCIQDDEANDAAEWNVDYEVLAVVRAGWQLCEVFSEGCAVHARLVEERTDVLALGVDRPGESDSLVASVEDRVVAVEEVQPKDPVADLRTIHQS